MPVKRYTRVELKAGETLIVYTDGLFENANQDGEQFGEDNFKQLLLQQQRLDMNILIDTVFRTVYDYCQPQAIDDDETLLVIKRISSTTD
jgi:sigma-B regulation protein RsbU (phosphoserine phosphatase)